MCSQYRKSYLYSKLHSIQNHDKLQKQEWCAASSHVNNFCLDTPKKLQRMKNQYTAVVQQKVKVKALKKKLEHQLSSKGICVDWGTHDGLSALVSMYGNEAIKGQKEESFLSIFCKQLLDALSVKTKRQVWWHPMINQVGIVHSPSNV